MGILDDAIREHLELKRRRGADPADIERAEREALGPVRRRFEEPADDGPVDDEGLASEDMNEDWHEPLPGAPAAGAEPLEDFDDLDAPGDPSRWEDEERLPPAEPLRPAPTSPPPVHGLDAETSEYDVAGEHGHEHEHEPEGEDVLEETPDFLQDTPDHDRLWFEQRPPRDFDFDG
jgi:hypothetical protein